MDIDNSIISIPLNLLLQT